eukprot:28657-Pelagococcus_subviridis.AAC.6
MRARAGGAKGCDERELEQKARTRCVHFSAETRRNALGDAPVRAETFVVNDTYKWALFFRSSRPPRARARVCPLTLARRKRRAPPRGGTTSAPPFCSPPRRTSGVRRCARERVQLLLIPAPSP